MDKDQSFVKHFCRLITTEELSDRRVIDFFDVVQSIVSTKIMMGYVSSEESSVTVDVIAYVNEQGNNVYEILLDDAIEESEGDEISSALMEEFFDIDFDFEVSIEV